MNTVKVFFFATLKEKAGTTSAELELADGATVAQFKQKVLESFPALPNASSAMVVAVNKEYAFDEEAIPHGAEIALFPPVSGG